VAALSHPHICPVYDIGTQDGLDYLVMEYHMAELRHSCAGEMI